MKPARKRVSPAALAAGGGSAARRQRRRPSRPAPPGSIDVQYEPVAKAAPRAAGRAGLLGGPHRSHPGAAAAQAGGAGAPQDRALHADERPAGDRRRAQGPAGRQLRPGGRRRAATTRTATTWVSPTSWRRCCARGPRREQDPQRRRHLARHRLRGRLARRAGLERGDHRRPARRCRRTARSASICCRTSCCTRRSPRARWATCATRCWPRSPPATTTRTSWPSAHFDNLLFGEKHPERLGADRRGRPQDHARAAGDVLEDLLPPEPRHPGRRRRRRPRPAARRRSRRRSAAGRAARARPAPGWTVPPLTATRMLLVDRPDLTQATIVLGHARHQARRPALVRGHADELRARRLRLLVAPHDRGARQARADLRHRLVVRRVALPGRVPRQSPRPRTRPCGTRCSPRWTRSAA